MITYYQRTVKDQKLKRLESFKIGSLIHVEKPSAEEIEFLAKKFNLDINIMRDALDPYEAPRMEIKKKTTYIFTRVPRYDGALKNISTFPTMFVLGKDFLLLFSLEETSFLITALRRHKKHYTTQRTKLFITLFFEVENRYNELLNKIDNRINYFGLNVGKVQDQDLVSFVRYEVILNEFIRALLPLRHVLTTIMAGKILEIYQYDKELIEDLQLNNEQLIERTKSNLTNIANLRQAQEVISTNRLNRVIKVLTVSTVVLALPTMITSFYGMNVHLPWADRSLTFFGIVLFIVLFILVFLWFLRKKKII
ncbi:MAG: magnesium transporter CorA family protein [Patescibacteria group bacterium]|nr:magnesium transporter CorA family protein [Patescibacteria group bacterium]MDD3777927.1 magnesium transporter CorA family protein [Patescibacteria group bacterium]MDD4443731.1 magnesium transporter CorA family protein [Patescibacteria group bacterium]NCU39668.1 magnesium transporter CorA family protein [Candidatus Falkowbacteria bacterium]